MLGHTLGYVYGRWSDICRSAAANLADTSVLNRLGRAQEVRDRVIALRNQGALWTCDIVTLEVAFRARDASGWQQTIAQQHDLAQALVTPGVCARAIEVQGQLATRGHHRIAVPDLLVAAAAEDAGVTVLHYDGDFDVIARATRQPVEWVVPRGSID